MTWMIVGPLILILMGLGLAWNHGAHRKPSPPIDPLIDVGDGVSIRQSKLAERTK